jgi:iron complex outermembrane receptor protein/vitamin B12 transporter
MRGGENSHLLIMIDGIKVNDSTTTRGSAYDLSTVDVNQIDRVEILRGPASAIYGGEALSGVINIITRRPAGAGVHGSGYLGLGQDHYSRAGATVAVGGDALQGQVSLGTARDGKAGDDANMRLNTVSGSLRLAPGNGFDAELFGHHADRKSAAFPDDSGGNRLAVNRGKTTRDSGDTTYGARLGLGDLQTLRVQALASTYERTERADNAFIDGGVRFPVPPFTSDSNFKRSTLQLTAARAWGNVASLVVGTEVQYEKGTLTSIGDFFGAGSPQTFDFNLGRRTRSIFGEGRFAIGSQLTAQVGRRQDKVQGLDSLTTPHLGLVWALPDGATSLKGSYSEGYKPPSFFALGFPIGANPDLRPERSRNTELTLAHRVGSSGKSSVQVSVYQIDYKDLVDFDGATFTNINRGKIVVRGIEPSMDLELDTRLRGQLTATLLDIKVEDGLQPLRNRPERRLTGNLVYDLADNMSVVAALNHTGGFLDRSNPTGDIDMPSYMTVDLGFAMRSGLWRFKLSLDNALDKHYEQFVGFPAQGRRLRAEVRTSF